MRGLGVHVVDHRAIHANGSTRPRVILVARTEFFRQLLPLPERPPGVATFNRAVGIVPVIHHPKLQRGTFGNLQSFERLTGLHQAQQMETPVQRADIRVGGNYCDRLVFNTR